MRIEKEFKKNGFFWLPDKPDDRLPGVLTIQNGGKIELELVGHFENALRALLDSDQIKRINGQIEDHCLITLDRCFYVTRNFAPGIGKSVVCVYRAFLGAAWDKEEYITFQTLSFTVDCLFEWVGISGIDIKRSNLNKSYKIDYDQPENIKMALDYGMELEICFGYEIPLLARAKEIQISQSVYFNLKSDSLRPIQEFIDIVFKIAKLMCFVMDETVSIKNLIAKTPDLQVEELNGQKRFQPIHIYYKSNPFTEKLPKLNQQKMLFTFETIASNPADVFNKWIKAHESISPAIDLYFSTMTGAYRYQTGSFLALAQGLETFHRRTSNKTKMDSEDYDRLVTKVMKNCPKDHLSWLEGRLKYGNELTLRNRLKSLIKPFNKYLGNNNERNKLISEIVDTRNYLTHYDPDLKNRALKGKGLWALCTKMEIIFNLLFLKEIGFSDKEIDRMVENSNPLIRKLNVAGLVQRK